MAPLKRPNFEALSSSSAATDAGKRVKFDASASTAAPRSSRPSASQTAADDFEEDLETSAKKSRAEVIEDGYESDSSAGSDGGFGVGGGRKGAARTGADGGEGDDGADDDDMFGPAKDDDMREKDKGKAKEFLEMGDIEGQEFGRAYDGVDPDEEEYLPEDDLANTDDAPRGKRSKEGMGYTLSSFNMQEELAEGRFAADGSYVQNAADPLAAHDSWLTGLSKHEIRAAAESKARREADLRRREEEDSRKGEAQLAQERDDCLIGLLKIVREGETVARALGRLGKKKKREGGKVVRRVVKPKVGEDVDMTEAGDGQLAAGVAGAAAPAEEDPLSAKINLLTHLASTLLSTHGELEIYDQSYDDIIKTLKSEGAVRRDWVPPVDPDIELERQAELAAKQSAASQSDSTSANHSRPLIARKSGAAAPPPPTAEQAAVKFKYKWVSPPKDQPADAEYGPYTRKELDEWVAGGYFGPAGVAISVKREGEGEWKSWREAIAA